MLIVIRGVVVIFMLCLICSLSCLCDRLSVYSRPCSLQAHPSLLLHFAGGNLFGAILPIPLDIGHPYKVC